MTVIASSIRSLPIARMAELIAASDTWQLLCDAASAGEALAFIHYPEADDREGVDLPRCIIWNLLDWNHARTNRTEFSDSGQFGVMFQLAAEGDTLKEEFLSLLNYTGLIIQECDVIGGIADASGGVSYLNVVNWQQVAAPERCKAQHEDGGYYWQDIFAVRYSDEE